MYMYLCGVLLELDPRATGSAVSIMVSIQWKCPTENTFVTKTGILTSICTLRVMTLIATDSLSPQWLYTPVYNHFDECSWQDR